MIKRNILNSIISILILIVLLVKCENQKITRTKNVFLNPDCKNCSDDQINVIYIRASTPYDVLHFLYAGGEITKTLSAVIVYSTDNNSQISINWDYFKSDNSSLTTKALNFSGTGFSSVFGLVFTKLYLYQNGKDNDNLIQWGFDEFKWEVIKDVNDSISFVSKGFRDSFSNPLKLFSNGSEINIKFTYQVSDMDNPVKPRLHYNSNNTMFNMVLKNLNTSSSNNPRFMVQLALINSGGTGSMSLKNIPSFDDELSPGVFRMINFLGQNDSDANQTYIQWKPVSYTVEGDTSITSISVATASDPQRLKDSYDMDSTNSVIKSSIVYMAADNAILEPTSNTALVNVTFGSQGEKGYSKYLTWYASFGYGSPPKAAVSITIIMVIIFGVGVPFICVLVGSIYLVVKRRLNRNSANPYASIDEQIN